MHILSATVSRSDLSVPSMKKAILNKGAINKPKIQIKKSNITFNFSKITDK